MKCIITNEKINNIIILKQIEIIINNLNTNINKYKSFICDSSELTDKLISYKDSIDEGVTKLLLDIINWMNKAKQEEHSETLHKEIINITTFHLIALQNNYHVLRNNVKVNCNFDDFINNITEIPFIYNLYTERSDMIFIDTNYIKLNHNKTIEEIIENIPIKHYNKLIKTFYEYFVQNYERDNNNSNTQFLYNCLEILNNNESILHQKSYHNIVTSLLNSLLY